MAFAKGQIVGVEGASYLGRAFGTARTPAGGCCTPLETEDMSTGNRMRGKTGVARDATCMQGPTERFTLAACGSRRLRLSHLDRCIFACNHQEIMGRLISACRWGPRAVSFPIILTGRTQGRTEQCEGAQLLTMSGLVEAGAAPPFATRYGSIISRKSARDKNRSTRVRYIYIHIHIIDFFRIFQFSHIKL
jgi:hypothetical protein